MERNIDDFLLDPEQQQRLDSLTEEQFYSSLEKEITEAIISAIAPYADHQPTNIGDTQLDPLSRSKSARNYAYGGSGNEMIKRQDKINLSRNKDLNIAKSTIRSAFEAIIAASNKTILGDQITSILKQTETRLFQKIDQKIKAEQNN